MYYTAAYVKGFKFRDVFVVNETQLPSRTCRFNVSGGKEGVSKRPQIMKLIVSAGAVNMVDFSTRFQYNWFSSS